MRRVFKILILSVLCLLFGGLIVYTIHYNHIVWLQEYNKQMDILGYYKEDIHLLDQHFEHIKIIFLIVLDVVVGSIATGYFIFLITD